MNAASLGLPHRMLPVALEWGTAAVWLALVGCTLAAVTAPFAPCVRAESLDGLEAQALDRYLDDLARGEPGQAVQVDRLGELSWPNLRRLMERYASLTDPIDPATHRAFQALLERNTRTALYPWTLISTYSPELASFLVAPATDDLPRQLYSQLLKSPERRAADLVVRLAPAVSLQSLGQQRDPQSQRLCEAWNRRLARGHEHRPIPELERLLERIVAMPPVDSEPALREAWLEFLGRWPATRRAYAAQVRQGLTAQDESAVLSVLRVLERVPGESDQVVAVLRRNVRRPAVVEAALKALAANAVEDQSAAMRSLWAELPGPPSRARYLALLAMAVHPAGNEDLAVEALRQEPFDYLDPALAILRDGPDRLARQAIALLLDTTDRGHEEALRLATRRRLQGFEKAALKLALDAQRPAIARQSALAYLSTAEGRWRRQVLPLLEVRSGDVRLAAIQSFGPPMGLSPEDREEIGPALIRVAQNDPSDGHRQEALFALGQWQDPHTAALFQQVLQDNPAMLLSEQDFSETVYWRYRHRLVALVGLARLQNAGAAKELASLHERGGPTERMDVLLAWHSLRECPDQALADLRSSEPKLLATAVRLIVDYGTRQQRAEMLLLVDQRPLWQAFRESGIDDHNLLEMIEEARHVARH